MADGVPAGELTHELIATARRALADTANRTCTTAEPHIVSDRTRRGRGVPSIVVDAEQNAITCVTETGRQSAARLGRSRTVLAGPLG
jgi:hypothetical protein